MPVKPAVVKNHLRNFEFKKLFVNELGWDQPGPDVTVSLGERDYDFKAVAQKRGLQVFEYVTPESGTFPDYPTRVKLERRVVKEAQEHILIFTDAARTRQVWQWVKREANAPPRPREVPFHEGHAGEVLFQKLQHLFVGLDEEVNLTLVDVIGRRKQAFDVDKLTKRFFSQFQEEHAAFLAFVKDIANEGDRAWYASLMLNRLMFVYFIQKKRFLADDPDYLRNKLTDVQKTQGSGKFHSFYRYFLLRLFHEGLGQKTGDRKPDLEKLLGTVPYLNGGLFDVHDLETANAEIRIPDEAFARLFTFFDQWQWHLDDRPLRSDREINPDVLGYIFEQFINKKQMGAYYTKEDITGYIARNTLLPFVLSRAAELCAVAFKPDGTVWKLLRDEPDRYIYEAVKKGVDLPLPADITAGIADVSKRTGWNRPAADGFANPTETWREHAVRRQRCLELRAKLKDGKVTTVNDLVTLNLDIVRFVTDVIVGCEGSDLLKAIYQTLTTVSVLDPTCGSGAFLFAALNILDPLYDACLERMQVFVDEADQSDAPGAKQRHAEFRAVLKEAERHPNRRYFVLKSIIVNNLFGVDIMDEAVEICKLRLFLKLVAQVEKTKDLEPLPDIDFNVRPGNTLVGFASLDEARKVVDLTSEGDLEAIRKDAEDLDRKFRLFREYQTSLQDGQLALSWTKGDLRKRQRALSDRLDRYLAGAYSVKVGNEKAFHAWRESHKPFHWFAEFYGIMSGGGFDVIVGNPPYVEYRLVRSEYTILDSVYRSSTTENLYCFCQERAGNLTSRQGRSGMIVPSSLLGLDEVLPLRKYLLSRFSKSWFSTYSIRPSKLFEGVDQRLCIHLGAPDAVEMGQVSTTRYHHWRTEERPVLFDNIGYESSFVYEPLNRVAQLGSPTAARIVRSLATRAGTPISAVYSKGNTGTLMHYHRSPRYWIRAMDFEQYFKSATRSRSRASALRWPGFLVVPASGTRRPTRP